MRNVMKLFFVTGVAVTVISAVTALLCGALVAARGITPGGDIQTFYAAGYRSPTAGEESRKMRASGGAGAVTDGDFVIGAVYSDRADAESVAEKNGYELIALECGNGDFARAAAKYAAECEELWRALESGQMSESDAMSALASVAVRLNGELSDSGEAAAAGAAVMCAVTDGLYPAAGNIRYASALLAIASASGEEERGYFSSFNR